MSKERELRPKNHNILIIRQPDGIVTYTESINETELSKIIEKIEMSGCVVLEISTSDDVEQVLQRYLSSHEYDENNVVNILR